MKVVDYDSVINWINSQKEKAFLIFGTDVREFRGKGRRKEYKKELKKIKNNCIEKIIDELFKIIESVLKDLCEFLPYYPAIILNVL
ncbi:hypothetical protein Stok01_02807 [Sulfurisphaera tokodaii]|uniref:hypothetical protein n=1 Tax=Sulfurisphaera tokodaii TaxID=111955 RepID=UPI00069CACA3|nr:hypothetical protein [Sulfurisphaera tokodaii]